MPFQIPPDKISAEALEMLISEFVSRDGTDYGAIEASMEQKVSQVRLALDRGHAIIAFDEVSESCDILSKEQWREREQQLSD